MPGPAAGLLVSLACGLLFARAAGATAQLARLFIMLVGPQFFLHAAPLDQLLESALGLSRSVPCREHASASSFVLHSETRSRRIAKGGGVMVHKKSVYSGPKEMDRGIYCERHGVKNGLKPALWLPFRSAGRIRSNLSAICKHPLTLSRNSSLTGMSGPDPMQEGPGLPAERKNLENGPFARNIQQNPISAR